ncbi:hypothetical protein STEG23_019273 [Scotinomys teguina]
MQPGQTTNSAASHPVDGSDAVTGDEEFTTACSEENRQDRRVTRKHWQSPSLLLCLPPCVLRLTGNFYILSSWRSGVFSPLAWLWATSSSSPCPAFLAIAKSEPFIDID